jgi:hypothetical protein
MNPATEIYIRLYVLNHLKVTAKESQKTFLEIKLEFLRRNQESRPLKIY